MGKLRNLIGMRFGRLLVLERAPNQGRYVCWKCQCDCGNQIVTRAASLTSGLTQSCGCLYKETRPKPKDLTGQRFGKLTVLTITDLRKDRRPLWKCQCDCGNIVLVKSHDLLSQNIQSCGCKHKSLGESQIELILQENSINYLYNQGYFTDLRSDNGTILRYDFILLDENQKPYRLIEFDGEQHFKQLPIYKETVEQVQKRDQLKNEYALAHALPLVRIPYYELNKITFDMLFGDTYLVKEK